MFPRRHFLALFLLPLLAHAAPPATPPPGPAKWESQIAAYEKEDAANPPKKGGIVFVGSSSIRLWKTLATDFPGLNVLNRGFGGSQISDSVAFLDRIVVPYEPRQVVFYAGGNDLNFGKAPAAVAKDFRAFATKVHAKLPETQIIFISSAPNHKRWAQIENVRTLNSLVERFCSENADYLKFLDVHPLMLGDDGKPLPDIFVADGLHMNPKGYALWTKALRPHLKPEE